MKYFLTTILLDFEKKTYKNKCTWAFFDTYQEAENYLTKHWFSMHEMWNNAAIIEEVPVGITAYSFCWDFKQDWYFTNDMQNILPTKIPFPSFTSMNND